MIKYDVFISYRRTAYDTAKLIAEKLKHEGYRVFFDVDTLTAGKFNEQLLEVISNCKDFVLVLPENALERCHEEDDWIRRETMCALERKKNIIPVMLDGFVWPKDMPPGMEELPNYQAITAVNREYFDMIMQRLIGFLQSTPSRPLKNWFIKAAIVLAVLFAFIGVGYGVVRHIADVTCEDIATQQTKVMSTIDLIGDVRQGIENNCSSFFSAASTFKDTKGCEEIEKEFSEYLRRAEKDLNDYKRTLPPPNFEFKGVEKYVMAYYHVKQEELKAFSAYYLSLYDDMGDVISMLQEMIKENDFTLDSKDVVNMNLKCTAHAINAFYYGYLGSLSLLPKSSRKAHYEMSKKWKHYPNGTPLDLPQEEYEQFQTYEMNCIQEMMEKVQTRVNYDNIILNTVENE